MITKTGVQCPKCKKRMFSFHRHDFKLCGCPNKTMVDGGDEYTRYGGQEMPDIIEWHDQLDGGPYKTKKVATRWPF